MKTVKSVLLLAFVSFFVACSSDDDRIGNWRKVESFGGTGRVGAVTFTIGDKAYVGLGIDLYAYELNDFWCCSRSGLDLVWEHAEPRTVPDEFAPRYGAVAFSDGEQAFVGLGYAQKANGGAGVRSEYYKDFWRFKPGEGWTRLKDFPGTPRQYAIGFYVPRKSGAKGKAYVAYGYYSEGNKDRVGAMKDWWEYDIATDTWTEMNQVYGEKRGGACVAVIDEAAYIFGGVDGSTYQNDVIKFTPYESVMFTPLDPLTDTDFHSYDSDYGLVPRGYATAFVVGKTADRSARIYLATGTRGSVLSDCWEFNPFERENGMWDEVTSFPSGHYRQAAVSFVLGDIGYIATGGSNYNVSQAQAITTDVSCYLFEPGIKDEDQDDDVKILDDYYRRR